MNKILPKREVVLSTPQNLTTSWVDLGSEINTWGCTKIAAWVTLDINDTNNPRIRILGKLESGGTKEYQTVIKSVSASDVKIEDNYIEWNADADMETLIEFELNGLVPYVQLQVQCGTVGSTAGQIDYCEVTKTWS